jgi:hypothetical protein
LSIFLYQIVQDGINSLPALAFAGTPDIRKYTSYVVVVGGWVVVVVVVTGTVVVVVVVLDVVVVVVVDVVVVVVVVGGVALSITTCDGACAGPLPYENVMFCRGLVILSMLPMGL